jgi:hypothetical protein
MFEQQLARPREQGVDRLAVFGQRRGAEQGLYLARRFARRHRAVADTA